MKGIYEATRRLCNEGPRKAGMVKNKEGKILTKGGEVKERTLYRSPEQASY